MMMVEIDGSFLFWLWNVEYKLIYDFIYCLGWYAGKWFEGLK